MEDEGGNRDVAVFAWSTIACKFGSIINLPDCSRLWCMLTSGRILQSQPQKHRESERTQQTEMKKKTGVGCSNEYKYVADVYIRSLFAVIINFSCVLILDTVF